MADQLFYVFNLQNKQDDYAQCLEFIEIMEGLKPDMEKESQLASIKSIVEKNQIFGGAAPKEKLAKRYFEVPLRYLDPESTPLVKQTRVCSH